MDIDWEHPTSGAERTTHYPAMLKRIKQEVGADRRVYATVDPTVMISNSVFSSPNAIDGVSLMTYDLGWWGNDPSNPFQGEHSLAGICRRTQPKPGPSRSVRQTIGRGCSARGEITCRTEKLGVGLPFYATR